jgi:TonB family protein
MTAIVEATIKVSAILAAGFGLAALLRARAAALRHWILAAAIVGAALAPALTAIAPAWHVGTFDRGRPAAGTTAAPATISAPAQSTVGVAMTVAVADAPRADRSDLASAVTRLWAGGAVVCVLPLLAGLARLAWIGYRSRRIVDPAWIEILADVKHESGLSRRIRLLETDRPALVVTWGAAAPKVLVPRDALAWPRERIRVVLRHELAHIRRADWLVQMLAEVVRAVYWFNPLLWIACRRVREESEHACDDAVIGLGVEAPEYASHLLDLARTMPPRRGVWVPAQAIVRPSSLERRITAMLNVRIDRKPLSAASRVTLSLAILAIAVGVAGFRAAAQSSTVLTGTITDQLGGVLPNAPVLLTDLGSGAKHEVRSSRNGQYEFVGLPSGEYLLSIDGIPGFKRVQQRIILTGDTMKRDVTLQIAAIQETIRVTDGPPPDAVPRGPVQRKPRPAAEPCAGDCVGGNIGVPTKLRDVKPIFPSSQSGTGGVVNLRGTIDTAGHVIGLQVVGEANADLAQAAITAVSQWEFEPTRLDGVVIETEINVSVSFAAVR